jgi:ribosomal protein S18 acetylase RimI-like enzyme
MMGDWGVDCDAGDAVICMVRLWPERYPADRATSFSIFEASAGLDETQRAGVRAAYCEAFGAPPYAETWTEADADAALGGDQRVFLATRDRDVVGFAALRPLRGALADVIVDQLVARDQTSRLWTEAQFISEFGITHNERGSGLGSALLRHVINAAPASAPIALETHAANQPAIQLYRRHGFRLADMAPHPVWAARLGDTWEFDMRIVLVR